MRVADACLVVLSLALAACSSASSTEDAEGADADLTKSAAPLSDAELAALLAKAPTKLSSKQSAQLVAATVNPLATTARLKLLNDFIGSRHESDLAQAMEEIVWATPRDFVSSPAGFGGQTFQTTIPMHGGIADPTKIVVAGTAKAAYALDVTIAGYHVKANIPAGSSEKDTAKLLGDALDAANDKIMKTIGADATYAPLGGDHAESPSGVDDLEISTEGAAITLLVSLNG